MKIPKRVSLGFGYVVTIEYVTRAEMAQQNPPLLGEKADDGYWDRDHRRIVIVNDELSYAHQRYVYAHEMVHAVNDFLDEYLDVWSISERKPVKAVKTALPLDGPTTTASGKG